MSNQPTITKHTSLYHQVAFARWGNNVRPLVVLNPDTDVPADLREQQESFPASQDFQICCWIGGDIAFLPRHSIIDYETGVAEGYDATPLSRSSVLQPLDNYADRETQMAVEMMGSLLHASPAQRVQAVAHRMSFYNTAN